MKILELYFGLKILVPVIIALFLLLFIAILFIKGSLYGKRKTKIDELMKNRGYEYYLRDVASCGGKAWWAYRKEGKSIDCDKLYNMKLRAVKKDYK